jgi:MoaA/NifB/PqqE/SkfB family radical SAM enzyme
MLAAFVAATRKRPGVLSASLHLEYDDPLDFAQRLAWLQRQHAGTVCVTCVATRANLPRLPELNALFEEHGIAFKVQPEKQDRDVIAYTAGERTALLQLGGHNGTGQIAPSFQGQLCWAGARYFIVDHRGEAYRCYPARRYKRDYLGNLLDESFSLHTQAEVCSYTYCNCTVPRQRGMVQTAHARIKSTE